MWALNINTTTEGHSSFDTFVQQRKHLEGDGGGTVGILWLYINGESWRAEKGWSAGLGLTQNKKGGVTVDINNDIIRHDRKFSNNGFIRVIVCRV